MDHESSAAPVRMVVSGSVVERCDTDQVLSIISARLRSRAGGLAVGSVNLDHLHHFRSLGATPASRLEWLLLADGMPIAWRGQLLTAKPWPRVTGADLLPAVLALAESAGQRVGFFGGSAQTHRLLAQRLRTHYPALVVSGMWAPDPADIESGSDALAADIRAAGTDILVVSLGKPRQEQWVDRHGFATGAKVFLPCGGAIDFLAGMTSRAPNWMQRAGLEWFYRLTREPQRLARRYLLQGPLALLRASRAQLICYPGVYYAGMPASESTETIESTETTETLVAAAQSATA
ncbi:teichoic acid biosynthesis protein [Mycobacterium sp. IEC1808]|uniref:WecB/TagA/CpsF family glycosyltransferase n=1 Tax=Mycobacterium sp. IEC1808 TaxID=1743230 RepID=UPI000A15D0F7|nr:WecB/TagA/CpsF family glycosyltransferase [Mycobacterium sp. IEC1808]ORW89871.1 teichoic acid biosynthesis protein [Mycobacterium sp. IEC1808]